MANKALEISRSGWKVVKDQDGTYHLERNVKMVQTINYTDVYTREGTVKYYDSRVLAQTDANYISGCEKEGREGYLPKKESHKSYMTYQELIDFTIAWKVRTLMQERNKS